MESFDRNRPRRCFDARFSYNQCRGSIAEEAERAIILRLMEGVPQQYLVMMGTAWRGQLTPDERNDDMAKMWYEDIEKMVKSADTMSKLRLKANFYRELWSDLPVLERIGKSRNEWVSGHLVKHFQEKLDMAYKGLSDQFPVPKSLGQKFSDFERRQATADKFNGAAQRKYFEITQPEAAELLRKRAAENLAEAAVERARIAVTVTTEVQNEEAESYTGDKARYTDLKDLSAYAGKRSPLVWPWEKGGAEGQDDCDAMDVDGPGDL